MTMSIHVSICINLTSIIYHHNYNTSVKSYTALYNGIRDERARTLETAKVLAMSCVVLGGGEFIDMFLWGD